MRRLFTALALVALASLVLAAASLAAKPVASASPSRLSFGPANIGASPNSQVVEFKNRTTVYIQLTTVDWPDGFLLGYPEYPTYNTCSAPYVTEPGGTCSLYVAFAPTALGRTSGKAVFRWQGGPEAGPMTAIGTTSVSMSGTGLE